MITFPVPNPLIATGLPPEASISFGVPGAMVLAVGIFFAVVILAIGVAPYLARSRRRVVARRLRAPQVAVPSMGARGAHR
jgi:hypothetical protein